MATTKAIGDLRVYLGTSGGGTVHVPDDLVTYLRCEEISRHAGGDKLDHAVFTYLLPVTGEHVENLQTPTGWTRQIEVWWNDGTTDHPLFWGDLTQQRLQVGATTENVVVTASVFPYHFGQTLRGPLVRDPLSGENVYLPEDITFNPLIDGVCEDNMSERTAGDMHLWGDPESYRTEKAREYQADELHVWTLEEAVKALCWTCNGDEEFIKNPKQEDFGNFAEAPNPQDIKLPRGKHLPFYLDALLHPFGFDWFVGLSEEEDVLEKRIRLFRYGVARPGETSKTVSMQPWGEALELDTEAESYTNCVAFDLTTEVGNAATKVRVEGGRKQYEITCELYRGWDEDDDDLTESDLDIANPESVYNTDPTKRPVWRLWVANEAGDWNGKRIGIGSIPSTPRDWSDFGVLVPRRRVIEDCLTKDAQGKRREPFVQWWNPASSETVKWEPLPQDEDGWSYKIHETQMAIEFIGRTPPLAMMAAGEDAALRVTCTITADERIYAEADPSGNSPNGRTNELEIDASNRFAYRHRVTFAEATSVPAAVSFSSIIELDEPGSEADERDDTEAIQQFADYVLEQEESALMQGRLLCPGTEVGYAIGDLIQKVAGREVSLNRNGASAPQEKPLQVTGYVIRPQQQVTELVTSALEADPFYRPGARPAMED